jgi:DNA polymerase elongation subunit (family B)
MPPTTTETPSRFEAPAALSPILYGHDPTERIVAVEPSDSKLVVFRRTADDAIERTTEDLRPWILFTSPRPELGDPAQELEGAGFRHLYEFPSIGQFQEIRRQIRDRHVEHLSYAAVVKLCLLRNGKTLFKGMSIGDVVRMQVDIETVGLSSAREEDRILVIAVKDNRGLLETLTGDEPEMLFRFVSLVRERDPDIIEGHNLYGFDLPYLIARAQRYGIRLGLGRDGSDLRVGTERNFAIGGITRPFAPVYAYGRHFVDTLLAVQRFDWAKGELTSYGLKSVARAFGFAEGERIEIPRDEMERHFRDDRERVLTYARQDVIETARLAELVTATEFYQTQMIPDAYGAAAVTGTGEKINSIFIRSYLHAGMAIPRPQPPRPYPGGYTELREQGVIDRVVKADVESLYPSLMLAEKIKPRSDTLNVFLPALAELTNRRLEAKAEARTATGTEAHYWDGLQNSFKVLINSFYGYLGAGSFHFNDYEAAGRITELGRNLVVDISRRLEDSGSRIIEIDTDGVYFVPPETVQGEEAERQYVAEIGSALPQGIRLAFDGRYRAMVSLKTKNYVLFDYDGKKTLKGASLRSRADEAYGREFLELAIDLLIEHRLEEIAELYARCIDDILCCRTPIEKLARRQRVTEKTHTSSAKERSRAVVGSTAVGEYITVYERKDGSLALLENYSQGDENIFYYMDKLHKFASRLKEAFSGDFDRLIPRPTPQGLPQNLQQSLDLFGE